MKDDVQMVVVPSVPSYISQGSIIEKYFFDVFVLQKRFSQKLRCFPVVLILAYVDWRELSVHSDGPDISASTVAV